MENTTLDINLLAKIVKKIIENFIEMWNSKISPGKVKHNHIDVTLLKEDTKYYSIQVTNYGLTTNCIFQFLNDVFRDLLTAGILRGNLSFATIYSRNESHEEENIYDLHFEEDNMFLYKTTDNRELKNFSLWKEYLSFKLKYKLVFCDREKFKQHILSEINSWQASNPSTKFTYRHGHVVVYNNHIALDDDYKSCHVLSTVLTSIIKQSLNNEFKEHCVTSLNVDNSHQAECALLVKLLPLIHKNYVFFRDTDDST